MAIQAEQEYEPTTDTGSIRIFPEGLAGTHGQVFDSHKNPIAPWASAGTGEIWVRVGNAKSGTITEVGFGVQTWQIIF